MWKAGDDEEKVSSLLKDAHISEKDLKEEGVTSDMIKTIVALTQNEGESYEDYIKRLAGNESAHSIKVLELEDSLNLSVYSDLKESDYQMIKNYIGALNYLNTIPYNI